MTDNDIDQGQVLINQALALAALKRNAGRPAAPDNGPRVLAAPSPHDYLFGSWRDRLAHWAHIPQTEGIGGNHDHRVRTVAAISHLDGAIDALGKRDRNGTRKFLLDTRAKLQAALDAFDSVKEDLSGPVGRALIAKIATTRASLSAAQDAVHFATRDNVAELTLALHVEEAEGRELDRELVSIYESFEPPHLDNWEALIKDARGSTSDLERLPSRDPTVRQIHRVIDAGLNADPAIARLWIAYETKSEHTLVAWRWRAFAEAAGL
ncbi:MAG TPA: hypothetical protein VHW01_03960 [Polyangiaceae bacterium]|nr:hypothetical protein [Polyangiaceae bacterium]